MKGLLVLIVIVGVGAGIGAIVVGSRTFEGTVVEKPYETGLRWSRMQEEKLALGWTARIENKGLFTGRNEMVVSVQTKDGLPLAQAEVSVKVSRPSTTDYDRLYPLKETDRGLYSADAVVLPLYGHWIITIEVSKGGHRDVFDEHVFAEKKEG